MLLLDVNIVLAAHRDDHPHFPVVRNWFDELLEAGDSFTVPTVVWDSFLRLVTNRRIFQVPTPLGDAFTFIEATCAQPQHILTTPGPRHLSILKRLTDEAGATGDLVPDAVVAAVAAEHGCEVVTLDRDFTRFTSVPHRRLGLR